jgi:hypothetical protein
VKVPVLPADPDGVTTVIGPVVAPAGTVALIEPAETTVKLAALVPLNCTSVALLNPDPMIVTIVPALPLTGEKLFILGKTVKASVLVAVPAAVVTLIGPLVANTGTVTLIEVGDSTVKGAFTLTLTPLNFTDCTELNPEPVIVTAVAAVPLAGERLFITGKTLKLVLLDMTVGLVERVMFIKPVIAPAGKVAVILLSETIVKLVAARLLNLTPVAELKPEPEIVTTVPATPLAGENSAMPGKTVKLVELVTVVPFPFTLIGPLIAPTGTVALSNDAETNVVALDDIVPPFGPENCTIESWVKPLPEIDMSVPGLPLGGVKLVIFGSTVKDSVLVPVPDAVVTLIGPLTAVVGTVALIEVEFITVKAAATLPNLTDETATKVLPVIVTVVPAGPLRGVKLSTLGKTLKLAALVKVPAGVMTRINPVVAVDGTVAIIKLSETAVNVAVERPNFTPVALLKPEPKISTFVSTGPPAGAKLLMPFKTVKMSALAPVLLPDDVVTLMIPVVAPSGTVALISCGEKTVKLVAFTPLKLTAVAPVKPLPNIVTIVPILPLVGDRLVILGVTRKSVALVSVPLEVVTLILPLVVAGTFAVILVSESTLKKVVLMPLNFTEVTPVKPVPVIVTSIPTEPLEGVKPVMPEPIVKSLSLKAVPPGVVTLIFPVVALAGTVATIWLCTLKVIVALAPLKFTEVALAKFEPLMVTIVPAVPIFGEKSVIWGGAGAMLKAALVAEVRPLDVATSV